MIFKVPNVGGYYSFAMVEIMGEEETMVQQWYTIPETRTIFLGRDEELGMDIFTHNPDSDQDIERFLTCTEYLADNPIHLLAKSLADIRKCITVTYEDTDGKDIKGTLHDYVKNNKNTLKIKSAPELNKYFKKVED